MKQKQKIKKGKIPTPYRWFPLAVIEAWGIWMNA